MTKADCLYKECIAFWQRMGMQKEDNIMAMSMLDVVNSNVAGCAAYNIEYYIERAKNLVRKLNQKEFDLNRGKNGWLKNTGL